MAFISDKALRQAVLCGLVRAGAGVQIHFPNQRAAAQLLHRPLRLHPVRPRWLSALSANSAHPEHDACGNAHSN